MGHMTWSLGVVLCATFLNGAMAGASLYLCRQAARLNRKAQAAYNGAAQFYRDARDIMQDDTPL